MKRNPYLILCFVFALFVSLSGYAQTGFTGGSPQSLTVCANSGATSINSLLTFNAPSGDVIGWSVSATPPNGTLGGFTAAAVSTGTPTTPSGLIYTPHIGYSGPDSFTIQGSDNGIPFSVVKIYVTITALPPTIAGATSVCQGHIIPLSDPISGGTWTSSNTSVATITTSGLVSGVSGGLVAFSYTVGSCSSTKNVTVNPTSPIAGNFVICPGLTTTFSDAVPGGTWTSGSPGMATVVAGSGDVTGVSAGTATITYTYTTGCISFVTETINPNPNPIIGFPMVCIGGTATLSDGSTGGVWTSDNTTNATIDPVTGIMSGLTVGAANISYTYPSTGCAAVQGILVNALPSVYSVFGGGSYCAADSGVHIYMLPSDFGTNYYLHIGTSVVGPFFGTGTTLDFGLQMLGGAYTATATDPFTGCSNIMSGSATVTVIPSVLTAVGISASAGDTVCGGTTEIFTAVPVNSGVAPHYQWMINGSLLVIDTSAYVYIPGNNDSIIVTMASDTLCGFPDSARDTLVMTVVDRAVPTVSLTATPSVVCMGSAFTLTPTPVYGGTSPSYYYTRNGTVVGAGPVLHYKPSDKDVFTCYLVSDFFCRLADTVSGSLAAVVDTPVIPFFVITASSPILTSPGQLDTLSAIVTNTTGPFSYQWILNDSVIAGATTDSFISNQFNYDGNDSITCVVTHYGACYLTTFNFFRLLNNVGVKQIASSVANINVTPNPSKGAFLITGFLGTNMDEPATLEITNMLGETVYKDGFVTRNGNVSEQVATSGLANGMYLLNLRSATAHKVFHIVIEQ